MIGAYLPFKIEKGVKILFPLGFFIFYFSDDAIKVLTPAGNHYVFNQSSTFFVDLNSINIPNDRYWSDYARIKQSKWILP